MRAKLSILTAVLLIAASATAYAADAVKATLSQALIHINNQEARPGKEYGVLNYKNHIYVPIRYVSERLGAFAGYDPAAKAVHIDGRPALQSNLKSAQSASDANGDFKLRLFADKTKYASGEPLTVWSRIERTGQEPLTIMHAPALIHFYIEDESGYRETEARVLSALTSTIKPDDDWLSLMPPHLIVQYNARKANAGDLETYLAREPRPAVLPAGTYRIGAIAEYGIGKLTPGNAQKKLTAEITVTID